MRILSGKDIGKRVRIRDGSVATILAIYHPYNTFDIYDVELSNGMIVMNRDVVAVLKPEKVESKKPKIVTIEKYINVYPNRDSRDLYESLYDADKYACMNRVACVKLTGCYELPNEN